MTRPIETIRGNVVDLHAGVIRPASVVVEDGRIAAIEPDRDAGSGADPGAEHSTYLMPGFVDGHLHVESSMLPPPEFARLAMAHGTVAVVADPHEIGNVLGVDGVRYMIDAGESSPLKFYFGAPPCVPATPFESSGATIDVDEVDDLLDDPRVRFLGEVMNWPGVLARDPGVMAKLASARRRGKLIDGHAPGLTGDDARAYAAAGITTDHECFTLGEAEDKIAAGMTIGIRDGSAAKNLDALLPLLAGRAEHCFFCTDDCHPDDLLHGHIDRLARRAIAAGYEVLDVLRVACINAPRHYGLDAGSSQDVGALRVGDPADFIEVDSLERLRVIRTVIDGQVVAERGEAVSPRVMVPVVNRFEARPEATAAFEIAAGSGAGAGGVARVRVIEARDGQLVTGESEMEALVRDGVAVPDVSRDLLEIAVVSRYDDRAPACAFVRGFGLKRGAIASSVAHDSHNIVAVGASPEAICRAVNAVIEARGGIAVVDPDGEDAPGSGSDSDGGPGLCHLLPLPIAGIMSDRDGREVGTRYAELTARARALGCPLTSPLMTLSFMALLVIPDLKLSDRGLFDGRHFRFVQLFAPRPSTIT